MGSNTLLSPALVALAMLPYIVALFLLLFLLVVIPDITMWLPILMGFAN